MATIRLTRRVMAPIDEVWASWADFGNIYRFNPNLKHSRLLSDPARPIGVGSERHCDLADRKHWLRERIIDFRPGRSFTVDVYESSMPLKSMRARIELRKLSDQHTSVTMTAFFEPKLGLVGALLAPLMKRRFRPMMRALLECNAAHVEHGEIVPTAA